MSLLILFEIEGKDAKRRGRTAHLLKDKQIPSVGVFDEVSFYTLFQGDEYPIYTLRDYSRPSHKGYRNTIEPPDGNNVVPLRCDTIQLVQNGCSFHKLQSEDSIQHLKDILRIVDSIDLNDAIRNTTRLSLFHFSLHDQAINWLDRLPAGSISTWEDLTTRYAAKVRLRKMSVEKAWATIKELARYEDEGWNDPILLEEGSIDYKKPNIEQLLWVIECKVDMLMKNAISLMGRSEEVCGMKSDMMHQLPPKPSR
uniref:MAK10-like protein n=1 Tax=Tanacetum cinerariifolium TaxID=118510 RepID=A0A6L2NLE8_TANCI|nr:MAK10-like protein [Tanacetum cinerariifolium]